MALQVFIVDVRSNKKQIKDAVGRLYDIQTQKINTLIRYVRVNISLQAVMHQFCKATQWKMIRLLFIVTMFHESTLGQDEGMQASEYVFHVQAGWCQEGVC